jgi:U3 small nucleolar RNA-associated protein 10
MNVAAVLEAFLPYHASTHFPRILAILVIPITSPFHALLQPLVKDPQPLTRSALITALGPSSDPSLRALREIMAFIPRAIEDKTVHRTLLTFWTGLTVDLVERQNGAKGGVQENVVRILVESFVVLLEAAGSNEMTLGRDITVSLLAIVHQC